MVTAFSMGLVWFTRGRERICMSLICMGFKIPSAWQAGVCKAHAMRRAGRIRGRSRTKSTARRITVLPNRTAEFAARFKRRGLLQCRKQAGHQPAALKQAVDLDVLVEGVCVCAAHAQAVKRGDTHRAGE